MNENTSKPWHLKSEDTGRKEDNCVVIEADKTAIIFGNHDEAALVAKAPELYHEVDEMCKRCFQANYELNIVPVCIDCKIEKLLKQARGEE